MQVTTIEGDHIRVALTAPVIGYDENDDGVIDDEEQAREEAPQSPHVAYTSTRSACSGSSSFDLSCKFFASPPFSKTEQSRSVAQLLRMIRC